MISNEQFVFWLKGYLDAVGSNDPTIKTIQDKLSQLSGADAQANSPNNNPGDGFTLDPRGTVVISDGTTTLRHK